MMSAPAESPALATSAFEVSIEINVCGDRISTNFSTAGRILLSSSLTDTLSAPGLVDSPPKSMIEAPSFSSVIACSVAASLDSNKPPSEKESGVVLITPMIIPRSLRS